MQHSYSLVKAITTVYAHALRLRLHTSPTVSINGFYNILTVHSPQCIYQLINIKH